MCHIILKLTQIKKAFFIVLLFVALEADAQQRDNSFKIMASFAGLGAAYEYNPTSIVYAQGLINTTFGFTRFGLQSKLALVKKKGFIIKAGVEGDYFFGDTLRVGGVKLGFNNFEFMPLIAFEWNVVGIEIPVILDKNFKTIFPLLGITLNVSKDEKSPREPKPKKKSKKEKK